MVNVTVKSWNESSKFPPVGEVVKFWDDDASDYRKGTVVYSSDKGATVDVGYLISSGDSGDFAEFTEEDQNYLDALDQIMKTIKESDHAFTSRQTAEKIYEQFKNGVIVVPETKKGYVLKCGFVRVGDVIEWNNYDRSHDNWEFIKVIDMTASQIVAHHLNHGYLVLERDTPYIRKVQVD